MMTMRKLLALACGSAVALAAAGAQDSLNLRGLVTSIAGNPIAGVEVRIDGSRFVTHSDQAGRFAFVNAPKGPQVLRFRLVGYLPSTATAHVPTVDPVEAQMLPLPPLLDTVRVIASVNVLAGVVVDQKDRPIPGASVEMLSGVSAATTTDSSGWFTFTAVRSGSVLVRARKLGFAAATTSIRLEDWRGLVIHLNPLDFNLSGSKLEAASGFGNTATYVWTETKQRLAMRGPHAIIIPREELASYDDYPLNEAIQRTPTGSAEASDLNAAGANVCVLLNGKNTVGPASLASYRAEDVEFVEMYPPGTELSGSIGRYVRNSGCRRVQVPGSFAVGPYYVVIWLRT
jgi:hypothetical protein